MSTAGTAFASLPQATTVIDSPVNNKEQATLETTRVLFFAHDTITDQEKRELPFKEFGGIYLPHIQTLRDTKHMLYRCRLTQLPPFKMIGDWDMMLPPEARQDGGRWTRSFTQTVVENGQAKDVTINGFLESKIDEDGNFKQKRSTHLLFSKRYPLHEAREATRRTGTRTPGGVVDIEALLNATAEEIMEAQYFFFPEWDEVTRGEVQLPATTKGLQEHLKVRVEAIKDLPWSGEKKAKYYSIGKDMIRSSTEYDRTVKEAIRQDEIGQKASYAKGNTDAVNSVISEQYLEQTGTRRKEDMLSGESSSVDRLADIMVKKELGDSDTENKRLLLEERKQYVAEVQGEFRERDEQEEIRLGMKKAIDEAVIEKTPHFSQPIAPTTEETEAKLQEVIAALPAITAAAEEATINEIVPISVHDTVTAKGRSATVIGKHFGKFKVKYDDDSVEEMVTRDDIA